MVLNTVQQIRWAPAGDEDLDVSAILSAARAEAMADTGNSIYGGELIDCFHGESGSPFSQAAKWALKAAFQATIYLRQEEYRDPSGKEYSKRDPIMLQEMVKTRLLPGLFNPEDGGEGAAVDVKDILIGPYSSTALLDACLAALSTQDGIILMPEGHYKSLGLHLKKVGIRSETFPVDLSGSGEIDPAVLKSTIEEYESQGIKVLGVLFTIPGNPFIVPYKRAKMEAIGQVLVDKKVPFIVDSLMERLAPPYIHLGAVSVFDESGTQQPLINHGMVITGNSKAFDAQGPEKYGAMVTGNSGFRDRVRSQMVELIQRETIHLACALMDNTPEAHIERKRRTLRCYQNEFRDRVDALNCKYRPFLGVNMFTVVSNPYGLFAALEMNNEIGSKLGIDNNVEMARRLIREAGVDNVAGIQMGIRYRLIVRLNVASPRKNMQFSHDYAAEAFGRIDKLAALMTDQWLLLQGREPPSSYEQGLPKHRRRPPRLARQPQSGPV